MEREYGVVKFNITSIFIITLQNPNGLGGVLGATAPKRVGLEHDSETELVLPLIGEEFSLQFPVLEKLNRPSFAQNGVVQVEK